jgi:hypothetical protein
MAAQRQVTAPDPEPAVRPAEYGMICFVPMTMSGVGYLAADLLGLNPDLWILFFFIGMALFLFLMGHQDSGHDPGAAVRQHCGTDAELLDA